MSGVTSGYLSAAYLAATFEAWMQWAAGTDPDPVPYLLAALEVLRVPGACAAPDRHRYPTSLVLRVILCAAMCA